MSKFAARIHILLASDASIGLVIRRGPSKSVATMLWNRRNDTFELGQWLKGRIYERRSDLSPDGKHLIYFALNGKWQSTVGGSWTAISRAPYLKAIALFAKGDGWHGGGIWTGTTSYWLNDGYGHQVVYDTTSVRRDLTHPTVTDFGGECLGIYYPRLLRAGWKLIDRIPVAKWKHQDIFEKSIGKGWVLRKIAHAEVGSLEGKGCYWDEHELVNQSKAMVITCPQWEWADLDGDRLVWAENGKLHTTNMKPSGLGHQVELFDFNQMSFTPIKAPY